MGTHVLIVFCVAFHLKPPDSLWLFNWQLALHSQFDVLTMSLMVRLNFEVLQSLHAYLKAYSTSHALALTNQWTVIKSHALVPERLDTPLQCAPQSTILLLWNISSVYTYLYLSSSEVKHSPHCLHSFSVIFFCLLLLLSYCALISTCSVLYNLWKGMLLNVLFLTKTQMHISVFDVHCYSGIFTSLL